jgi:PAS domain S-box-containing protein
MKLLFESKLFITLLIVSLAIIFSEILVHFQMVLFWEDRKHDMGYYLGFWTPLIDAIFVIFAVLFLRSFYEKELHKTISEKTTALNELNHTLEQKVQKQTKQLQIKNKELEEKNEMFTYLLDTTMEGIVISDTSNNILLSNKACAELFGVESKEEFIGKNIGDFIPEYEMPKLLKALEMSYEPPTRYDLKKIDGTIFPTLASGRDIIFNHQKARLSIILDLTQIKQQEQQLYEQSKMVAMGEMIGNIAHQWRQPLTTISTKATGSIVQKELGQLSDTMFIENMEVINTNTQYLSETIDTFRDFIKGKNTKEEIAVCHLLDESLTLIESSLKNNYIEINNSIHCLEDCGRRVFLSKHEFTQVIINILNNAKDIIMERKIQNAWVKLEHTFNNDSVIISIEDNGGGIKEDIIDKIFEPYFTTKHESVGTGLGLHMSYKIITESIGGKIYVKNTNNGAKFFIEIPLSTQK